MKRSVYLETTVIGYIAMRASRDLGMEPPLICTPFDLLEN